MNIGFDGKRAANNLTGLGNYSRSLVTQLARSFPQNQYFVYTPKVRVAAQIEAFFRTSGVTLRLGSGMLWRSLGIKKQLLRDRIDLYHGLSHEIPFGLSEAGIPAVVTVHDLIFLRFPQYFGRISRWIYELKCRYACKHADKIIAISECTKRDIISFFGIEPGKIDVIYQSCEDGFKTMASAAVKASVRARLGLPEQYLLYVGTIETRKNLLTLIRALPRIDTAYPLIVIGKETPYAELVKREIAKIGLKDRIRFLRNVSFEDLPVIYQMAAVFIYPSVFEGFGIPVIEALYSGVPVVAAKGSCLEEAGGPSSLYVNPDDHEGFAKAVNSILSAPEKAAEMREKGLHYVQRFNDNILSSQMMTVYTTVVSTRKN